MSTLSPQREERELIVFSGGNERWCCNVWAVFCKALKLEVILKVSTFFTEDPRKWENIKNSWKNENWPMTYKKKYGNN